MKLHSVVIPALASILFIGWGGSAAYAADTVVQIPLPGILDARSVTTLTGAQLVPWTLPTDGGGLQNGFATKAAVQSKGGPVANALPDDGRFLADARHPDVILNFSNAAVPASPQTHWMAPSTSITFAVPSATYSKLFLFFNGAAGGATVTVKLTFTGATQTETAKVPDYYADVAATDPVLFNLASDVAKFDSKTEKYETHHSITGVELHPMAGQTLTQVQINRATEGNLIFWGATGIATSSIMGAGGAANAGGAAGSSGSAGVGGASGDGSGGLAGANAQAGGSGPGGGGPNAGGGLGGSSASASTASPSVRPLASPAADSGCSVRTVHRDTYDFGAAAALLGAACGLRFASRCQRSRKRARRE